MGVLFDELGLIRVCDYSPSAAATSPPATPDPDPLSAGGGAAITFPGQQILARGPAITPAPASSAANPGPADLGRATMPSAHAPRGAAMTPSIRSHLSALSSVNATGNQLRVFTQELMTPSNAVCAAPTARSRR